MKYIYSNFRSKLRETLIMKLQIYIANELYTLLHN